MSDFSKFAPLLPAMRDAGVVVMKAFREGFSVKRKPDDTPVTSADLESDRILTAALRAEFPEIPVISEETAKDLWAVRRTWKKFFLVDPIDGTSEFVAHRNDFTLNIALVENGFVTLGLVGAPATDELFIGCGNAAFVLKLSDPDIRLSKPLRHVPAIDPLKGTLPAGARVLVSALHRDKETLDFVSNAGGTALPIGSSLKFCRIADGSGDYYPRLKKLHEWDIAAGHGVLKAAGGNVYALGTRDELRYGSETLETPAFEAY